MTKCIIEPASNGYILTTEHETGQDKDIIVVEDTGGKKHLVHLLYSLLEALGELGSKHDSERIRVITVDSDGNELYD